MHSLIWVMVRCHPVQPGLSTSYIEPGNELFLHRAIGQEKTPWRHVWTASCRYDQTIFNVCRSISTCCNFKVDSCSSQCLPRIASQPRIMYHYISFNGVDPYCYRQGCMALWIKLQTKRSKDGQCKWQGMATHYLQLTKSDCTVCICKQASSFAAKQSSPRRLFESHMELLGFPGRIRQKESAMEVLYVKQHGFQTSQSVILHKNLHKKSSMNPTEGAYHEHADLTKQSVSFPRFILHPKQHLNLKHGLV